MLGLLLWVLLLVVCWRLALVTLILWPIGVAVLPARELGGGRK
jgi:hypothetical protein